MLPDPEQISATPAAQSKDSYRLQFQVGIKWQKN
jgi:hypothetical protein